MKKLFILCLVVAMALSMLCSAAAEQGHGHRVLVARLGSGEQRQGRGECADGGHVGQGFLTAAGRAG